MPRGAQPGERRGGRAKGTPNKISGTVKENVAAVFEGLGGINGMLDWAKGNKTDFYRLYGKLLPTDLQHSGTLGTYAAQPIPVEQRDSDSLACPAGATAHSHPNGFGR